MQREQGPCPGESAGQAGSHWQRLELGTGLRTAHAQQAFALQLRAAAMWGGGQGGARNSLHCAHPAPHRPPMLSQSCGGGGESGGGGRPLVAQVCPCRRMGLDSVKAGPPSRRQRSGKGSQLRTEESVPLVEHGVGLGERGETGRGLEGSPASQRRGCTQTWGACRPPWDSCPQSQWNCYWNFPSCRTRVFWCAVASNCALCPPPWDSRVN